MTRWLVRVLLGVALVLGSVCLGAGQASAATTDVSRGEAVRQLDIVRQSIDQTLSLVKEGRAEQAFNEAKAGYLSHFEAVEIPLRVVDERLTSDAETKFAEIRGLISSGASTDEVRSNIVELRGLIDSAERRLTDPGLGAPAVIFGQSFLIIFREGLEAVLLVSVLLGYLEAAKATQYRRPILWGMAAAGVATLFTFVVLRSVLAAIPLGREILEAITALAAVAVLFYVSFWLVARLEQKRWLEFLRARVWTAVSVGSTTALMLVGFTAVYREGFESALFYQA
ncbi:MAG: high-affinity iron transporter, partial [Acidimicrobiia bacterium]|nr:high-affinity iron transporter [Acidimicrobiia bacterium]